MAMRAEDRIRPARPADAEAIARIYVDGWRSAYPGLLPDALLVGMDADRRQRRSWGRTLTRGGAQERVHVAVSEDDAVIGFASGGRARAGCLGYDSEIYTLYLDDEYQGSGVGRRLFTTLAAEIADLHGPSLIVWVLAGNPSRYFYQALGGRWVGRRPGTLQGAAIEEYGYGWPDAAVLGARQP